MSTRSTEPLQSEFPMFKLERNITISFLTIQGSGWGKPCKCRRLKMEEIYFHTCWTNVSMEHKKQFYTIFLEQLKIRREAMLDCFLSTLLGLHQNDTASDHVCLKKTVSKSMLKGSSESWHVRSTEHDRTAAACYWLLISSNVWEVGGFWVMWGWWMMGCNRAHL